MNASATPKHVAIIMDGNGRWAQSRGLDRAVGHRRGALCVDPIVQSCLAHNIEVLTLYSFSTENWSRSQQEVGALMSLCVEFLEIHEPMMIEKGVCLRHIGNRQGLPAEVLDAIDRTTQNTSGGTKMTLCLAINYGGRQEVVEVARQLSTQVATGKISADEITEQLFSQSLSTHGLADPDLVIRTAGESRLSNFLLWQASYAELYVSQVCWPDFTPAHFEVALRSYAQRHRKFGK